jgi:hypothetical protein
MDLYWWEEKNFDHSPNHSNKIILEVRTPDIMHVQKQKHLVWMMNSRSKLFGFRDVCGNEKSFHMYAVCMHAAFLQFIFGTKSSFLFGPVSL